MILGHQNQWNFLVKSAQLDKLSHGLLFSGQEQIGKKALAIEFIKFLSCQAGSKRPCQVCRSCQDIQKKVYPDFILIESDSSSKEISISQIRKLIEKLSLRPYSADFKTVIIDKAHLMSQEAQSCFLKLLEEPKGKALLILITEYPEILLPTIISRVQKIRFFPIKNSLIENHLAKQGISKNKAKQVLSFALGKPGAAIDLLSYPQKLENQEKIISDLAKIVNSDLSARFQYAKSFSDGSSGNLREVLDVWLRYFRNLLFSKIKKEESLTPFQNYSLIKLKKIISLIQSTNLLISTTNTNSRLALEILLMEL